MRVRRQNLREDVGEVVARGDENEADQLVGNLVAQPRHLYTKMTIAARYDMVVYHGDAGLIVLVQLRGANHGETQLNEKVSEPQYILRGLCSRDVLGFSCAQTDRGGRLGQSTHHTAREVDHMSVA